VTRLWARLTALDPRIQDLVLALAVTVSGLATIAAYRAQLHPLYLAVLLIIGQNMPLIWRRSYPVPVTLVCAIARVSYDVIGLGYAPVPLGIAIAFYTVLNRCGLRTCVITCVLALAGITISQAAPGHNQPYDFIVATLTIVVAGMAGLLARTRHAYLQEAEERAARAEAGRDQESARAAAAERARIARELHDVVAHHVSLMAVQAEAAASLLPGRPDQAKQSVEIIGDTARQALTELRRLLGVLRGPGEELQTAPSPSLGELGAVLELVRGTGLPVDFRVEGTPCVLSPGVDLTAYRIVQEALTNTMRHAPAAHAAVTLSYEPGYVTVSVANSASASSSASRSGSGAGRPLAPATARPAPVGRAGFGLAGIAERVASCGGSLSAGPTLAGGFAVTARLPAQ
jgi:signal transduction histidine kinase